MFGTVKSKVGVLALTATLGIGLTGLASPAFAGGRNSANAHACQHGGWTTLFRANGTPFNNQDACVSYGAQGGQYGTACWSNSVFFEDTRLTGPIDTPNDATTYNSSDGTCSGGVLGQSFWVSAPDFSTAVTLCPTGPSPFNAHSDGYTTAPTDLWICQLV